MGAEESSRFSGCVLLTTLPRFGAVDFVGGVAVAEKAVDAALAGGGAYLSVLSGAADVDAVDSRVGSEISVGC